MLRVIRVLGLDILVGHIVELETPIMNFKGQNIIMAFVTPDLPSTCQF